MSVFHFASKRECFLVMFLSRGRRNFVVTFSSHLFVKREGTRRKCHLNVTRISESTGESINLYSVNLSIQRNSVDFGNP